MRHNVLLRIVVGALAVMSMAFAAPGAQAAASGDGEPGGNSAEHRNDDSAHAARDERSAAAPAAAAEDDPALNEPQPASNADFSGNGANVHGAYDSTRDGSPSENGNGDGAAVGKPCAGCVGKADNKNPPGQQPDGSDANKGYECDENSGIGKTNPAHTGCVQASSNPPTVQSAGASVLGVSFTAPPADAAPAGAVLAAGATAPAAVAAGTLAATGSPSGLLALAAFGAVLVLTGAFLRRGARQRVA